MYKIKVAGVVHSLEPIFSPTGYAKAVFSIMDDLEVAAEGKKLLFHYTSPFYTTADQSIDRILKCIITEPRNVEWQLEIQEAN